MKRTYHVSNLISWGILVTLILGSGYYVYHSRSCAQPIAYAIGTFDPRFGISRSAFLADAQEAANLWNVQAGYAVFEYSADAASARLPINLVYDTRQQQAASGQSITQQEAALSGQKSRVATLQAQYNTAKQHYLNDQAAHKDIATLNREVDALNSLAQEMRTEITALNAKIDAVNAQATNFNTTAGSDFNEGEYQAQYGVQKIDIYEFTSHTQLVRVLAHEFGHALGLGHNTNPESIMYSENTATIIALSPEDKSALAEACTFSIKNLNLFANMSL